MNSRKVVTLILLGMGISSCQSINFYEESDLKNQSIKDYPVEDNSESLENQLTNLEQAKQLAWEASTLVQNPPHPQLTWQTAKEKWQQAIEILVKIPPEHSNFIEAQQKLTDYKNSYLLIQQQWEKAEQALQLNNQAIQQIQLEEYQTAITTLNQAVQLNPGQIQAYLNRGFAYAELNSHVSAIANYDKAIQIAPQSAEAYYYRGDEYLEAGENKKALSDYNQAIQLNPEYTKAYLDRGFIYANSGQTNQAVSDLKRQQNC